MTGAGGFIPKFPGIDFVLSPRVAFIEQVVSKGSTEDRGIFHEKDESLSTEGFHRLHILLGDSLCSHRAMFLKYGTAAVVVSMIDAGLRPGDAVQLRDPLGALRRFAGDETCRSEVPLQMIKSTARAEIPFSCNTTKSSAFLSSASLAQKIDFSRESNKHPSSFTHFRQRRSRVSPAPLSAGLLLR